MLHRFRNGVGACAWHRTSSRTPHRRHPRSRAPGRLPSRTASLRPWPSASRFRSRRRTFRRRPRMTRRWRLGTACGCGPVRLGDPADDAAGWTWRATPLLRRRPSSRMSPPPPRCRRFPDRRHRPQRLASAPRSRPWAVGQNGPIRRGGGGAVAVRPSRRLPAKALRPSPHAAPRPRPRTRSLPSWSALGPRSLRSWMGSPFRARRCRPVGKEAGPIGCGDASKGVVRDGEPTGEAGGPCRSLDCEHVPPSRRYGRSGLHVRVPLVRSSAARPPAPHPPRGSLPAGGRLPSVFADANTGSTRLDPEPDACLKG